MIQRLSVKSEEEIIGHADVERNGLYYSICAVCQFGNTGIHKLWISADAGSILLGTCLPKGKEFVLEKKIPVKAIGEGNIQITDRELCVREIQKRFRLSENQLYPYLSKLKDSTLTMDSGEYWIVFTDQNTNQNESESPTGQWSEPIISL